MHFPSAPQTDAARIVDSLWAEIPAREVVHSGLYGR